MTMSRVRSLVSSRSEHRARAAAPWRRWLPRLPLWTLILISTGAGAVVAAGCEHHTVESNAKAAEPPPVPVTLVAAGEVTVPRVLTLSGTLTGAQEAQVAAGVPGKVVATNIERGTYVKKGAVLARLDARTISAQAAEAAAQVESLKAQEKQSQLDCQRMDRMFEKGAISKADYDRTHTQCETSKWSVAAAEARKSLTATALHDTEIRAPFSGMVVERAVTTGEYVRADSRVATLVDVDDLRVELTVPEADVPLVRQGLPVEFRIAADDKSVHHGRVRYIGPSVRRQSRDAVVEATVDNDDKRLRPGMFVTAQVPLGQRTLPAVPASAVRTDGNLHHVFTVDGGRLQDRRVQVGEKKGDDVAILGGLKAGERVVAALGPDVRDGARAQVK